MQVENHQIRFPKPLKFQDLIDTIEYLDYNGIISFEKFKQLSYKEYKTIFPMVHPTLIAKAIIKLTDIKNVKTAPTEYITIKTIEESGKSIRTIQTTELI